MSNGNPVARFPIEGDPGRVTQFVTHEVGWDVEGLSREMDAMPQRIYSLRQKISPLRSEVVMIEDRYASRGRSISIWDADRTVLLSELKEEARVIYNRNPDFKTDGKGNQVKIEMTDGRAEDVAHAHPRYRKFLQEARDERKRAKEVRTEMGKLYDKLEAWKNRREAIKSRLEQVKADTYLLSSQMKL